MSGRYRLTLVLTRDEWEVEAAQEPDVIAAALLSAVRFGLKPETAARLAQSILTVESCRLGNWLLEVRS